LFLDGPGVWFNYHFDDF
jgi:hypothetical protein